jgi:iron complex outermembrane recepter protein
LQANYSSARSYGIFDFKPQFSTDVAVNRSFAHQRFTVNFAVSDLFKTRITRDDSHLLNNDFIYKERYDSRIFRLNLTYIFGNDKLKIHSQHNGTDEEKRRVKQSG